MEPYGRKKGDGFNAMLRIPGYIIKRELGTGGMATVYLAVQTSLERQVALKVMAPALAADQQFSKRFLREARTVAGLSHPNIVSIYDVGITKQHYHYFSMQMLPNGDFADRIVKGAPEREIIRVLQGICLALQYAHARGFVHRDVTPGNILFDASDTPILTDFGIARAVSAATRITGTGLSVGTSHYMSPEQARGREVDHRTDIYGLGAMAYEALAGEPPYDGEDGFAIAYSHVFDPIPQLPERLARWQPFIDRAMAKDPDDRFQDVEEVHDVLDTFLEKTTGAGRVREPPKLMSKRGFSSVLAKWKTKTFIRKLGDFGLKLKGPPDSVRYRVATAGSNFVRTLTGIGHWVAERLFFFLPAKYRPVSTLVVLFAFLALMLWQMGLPDKAIPTIDTDTVASNDTQSGDDKAPDGPDNQAVAANTTGNPAGVSDGPDVVGSNVNEGDDATTDLASNDELNPLDMGSRTLPDAGYENDIGPFEIPELVESTPPPEPQLVQIDSNGEVTAGEGNAVATTDESEFIAAELSAAREDMAADRLTTPANSNAYDRYTQVLSLQPENEQAQSGLAEIVRRYITLADDEVRQENYEQAAVLLRRARQVASESGVAETARARLAATNTLAVTRLLNRASTAEQARRVEEALADYQRVLQFEPTNATAIDAIAQIEARESLNEPFYDQLNNGGQGPQMIRLELVANAEDEAAPRQQLAVSRSEITVGQFGQFVQATGYYEDRANRRACRDQESIWRSSRKRTWDDPGFPQGDDHPVVCITWDAALAYADWLSSETGYPYRLLSESEWNVLFAQSDSVEACEHGNVADQQLELRKSGTDAAPCDDGWAFTAPFGQFSRSESQVFDLLGNVREWTADCWSETAPSFPPATFQAKLQSDCSQRVAKGISWLQAPPGEAPSARNGYDSDDAFNTVGFRLARPVD